jgi:hypothetical protein
MDAAAGTGLGSLQDVNWELVGSYAGLLGLATFSVCVGAFGSLPVCGFWNFPWALNETERVFV